MPVIARRRFQDGKEATKRLKMNFSKLQATGNDFIVVDARKADQNWAELAQAICQRHFGVGGDGLILVQNSRIADLKMRVFNPDGSEAEACGNGLRCCTKYGIERGMVDKTDLTIETLPGIRKVNAYMSQGKVEQVKVTMGAPRFQPEQIPVRIEGDIIPILNYPLELGGEKLTLSLVSMGNPHAVSFISRPVASFPLAKIGPEVERHPMFPQRSNFETARVLSRDKVEARVWERGVGETLACGSGACAIAVAARLLDYVDSEVDIMLPGGVLALSWDGVGEVVLSGPVEEVFTGQYRR
jgi:diaminopimelate epimerase